MLKIVIGCLIGITIIAASWVGWAIYSPQIAFFLARFKTDHAGTWGDSFGAFNALVSALAFGAVVLTLIVQGRSLSSQQKTQHRDRFETTFFHLLTLIREAREEARFQYSPEYVALFRDKMTISSKEVKTGHLAFRNAYREMECWVTDDEGVKIDKSKEEIADLYDNKVHVRFESTFGAYYRLIYTTLDRIKHDALLSKEEKQQYGNLIRGQFTGFEAVMAGVNGLTKYSKDFSTLVVEFRLLKYARRGPVYDLLQNIYPPEAFLGRDGTEALPEQIDEPALSKAEKRDGQAG